MERLGSDYGGWAVPADLIDETSTVYSGGAGHDVSFDVEILARFGARVRSFDPIERHLHGALERAGESSTYSVRHVAIAPADGPIIVWGSDDPDTGHVAADERYRGGRSFVVDGKTVATLARELEDERVDLLKIDIEGAEYDVVDTLDLGALGVRVFCVGLHATVPIKRALALVEAVQAQGFVLAARHDLDLSFIRRA